MSGQLGPEASLFRPMTDPFGRTIRYLRVSVTDRCDLRCFYCMSEDMTFLPKADLLTLEELDRLCSAFVAKGDPRQAQEAQNAQGSRRRFGLPRFQRAPAADPLISITSDGLRIVGALQAAYIGPAGRWGQPPAFRLSMIFPENRFPLFRVMAVKASE